MREIVLKLLGVLFLAFPLVAIRWNLAGRVRPGSSLFAPESNRLRWRLEIYSNDDDALAALVDPADVPFPVKRVRSSKAAQAEEDPEHAWTLPRIELDVEVADPLADESLAGLFGTDHRLRFITGNEAVLDARSRRLRVRAYRFG